ncbi:hypothetical protein CNMCM5793_008949 [Aspergillus hiratsukae]|uniref:Uncharacterized protein n=1 Tax=Aspergillus hiratsukae TaxID=1194566 RepID=A0A8H6PW14_9EURO|nr:hypothetical protein CNMCM5793_008949 [Aspergillus hiratsukae]KAF7162165.1 hypothetical protein CNMCM6106_009156 [Aspergillus hiratsukae]
MAGDKPEVSEVGFAGSSSARPTFGRRVLNHYKRWWWVHVIAIIVVVLVVTLPLVYVGYPNIAQGDINDSTLEIKEMIISDPTPTSFFLNQIQVIGSDSMFHPTIYAFDAAVSLLGAASAFATVRVPQVKANDGTVVNISQSLDLSDVGAFGGFATAVMQNEEIKLNIYGKPDLKQGGLPKIGVTYNKTVTMKALNKLDGFAITEMHFLSGNSSNSPNGANFGGTVYIPNPSVMTITMGNVTLDLSVEGNSVGTSYLTDLKLVPGNNTIPMLANVSLTAMTPYIAKYPNGIPVSISGSSTNSSVYNGQVIPYFSEALGSNTLNVTLNLAQLLS